MAQQLGVLAALAEALSSVSGTHPYLPWDSTLLLPLRELTHVTYIITRIQYTLKKPFLKSYYLYLTAPRYSLTIFSHPLTRLLPPLVTATLSFIL